MDITTVDIDAADDDTLNWLAAEAQGLQGLGYYGPDGPTGNNLTSIRCDTKAEAFALVEAALAAQENTVPEYVALQLDIENLFLCHFIEGQGPAMVSQPATRIDFATPFEDWFLGQHSGYAIAISKSSLLGCTANVTHDTDASDDATALDADESRARTRAILKVLQNKA